MQEQNHQFAVTQVFLNEEVYPFYQNPKTWPTTLQMTYDFLNHSGNVSPRDKKGRLLLRENAYQSERFEWTRSQPIKTASPVSIIHSDWSDVLWHDGYDAKRDALKKWYKTVADARVNLAVMLAEAGQTAEMLYAMSYRVGAALRALRKGFLFEAFREFKRAQSQFRSSYNRFQYRRGATDSVSLARQALERNSYEATRMRRMKASSRHRWTAPVIEIPVGIKPGQKYDNWWDLWLEYSYGWTPLYNDVYGAMISTVDNFTTPSKTVRTTKKYMMLYDQWGSNTGTQYKSRTIGRVNNTCTVKAEIVMENDFAHRMQTLGLQNPALVVWEKIPFSFVVDWFLPISNWLENITALSGLSLKQPSVTHTREWTLSCITTINRDNWSAPYVPVHVVQEGKMLLHRKLKTRVLGVPDVPTLKLENPASISHAITSLALLFQRNKGDWST